MRRELAPVMGADLAVHPHELDSAEVTALIARNLLNRIQKGGTFLVFGVASPDDVLALPPREVYDKELTIVGSIINLYTHERAVAMLQSLPLDRLPTRVFPLSKYEAAFEAQRQGREKITLRPNFTDEYARYWAASRKIGLQRLQ